LRHEGYVVIGIRSCPGLLIQEQEKVSRIAIPGAKEYRFSIKTHKI
jgi:hypothetical protein